MLYVHLLSSTLQIHMPCNMVSIMICFVRILDDHVNMGNLLVEFSFFFSNLFIDATFPIREASFFQLCHPLFFDVAERRRFCEAAFEFRRINLGKFERLIDLYSNTAIYDVDDWDQNLSLISIFYKILHYLDKQCLQQCAIVN
jgi:hypothetical protein